VSEVRTDKFICRCLAILLDGVDIQGKKCLLWNRQSNSVDPVFERLLRRYISLGTSLYIYSA